MIFSRIGFIRSIRNGDYLQGSSSFFKGLELEIYYLEEQWKLIMRKIRTFTFAILTSLMMFTSYGSPSHEDCLINQAGGETALLSLDQAIEEAYKHRPNLDAFDKIIEAQDWQARTELMGYAPQMTLSSSLLLERHEKGFHGVTRLEGHQLIYQFGGPVDRYKREKKSKKVLALQKEQVKHEIRNAVEQAFLQSWLLQKQERAIMAEYRAAHSSFKKAAHEWRLKLLDRALFYAAQSDFSHVQAWVRQYYHNVGNAEQQMAFLLGQSRPIAFGIVARAQKNNCTKPLTYLDWKPFKNIRMHSLARYKELAHDNRFDIKAIDQEIEVHKDTVSIVSKSNLPSFALFGSVSHSPTSPIGRKNFFSFGPSLSWNILDGTITAHKTRRAEAQLLAKMLERQQVLQEIDRDVADRYYKLNQSVARLKSRKIRLKQAKNDFVLKKQQYTVGDVSSVAFKQAKALWRQQYFLWLADLVDASIKEKNLAFVCGYSKNKQGSKIIYHQEV